ncbi:MAG: hypothetical protein ACXAEU_23840 [Candidatus Hodarchaeales archaeon]|jgi:hypothetical protein
MKNNQKALLNIRKIKEKLVLPRRGVIHKALLARSKQIQADDFKERNEVL